MKFWHMMVITLLLTVVWSAAVLRVAREVSSTPGFQKIENWWTKP